MWIDTHAHLFDYSGDALDLLLCEAKDAGVEAVLSTATSSDNAAVVVEQSTENGMVWAAVGVSPFDCTRVPADWYTQLESLCCRQKVVAIGEIGIDATNPTYPYLKKQEPVFESQLGVARKTGLPVVIHSRGSEERAVDICLNSGISMVVFHCFTGDRNAIAKVIRHGYYISLSGIITFKNCLLREYIKDISIEQLLIETDCPYLAPVPHRGKQNRPAWIHFIGEEVARLFGVSVETLAGQLRKNFETVFRININEA